MLDIGLMSGKTVEQDKRGNVVTKYDGKKLEKNVQAYVGEQLLPGIPDDIAINLVAPKLPWTAFHMLAAISRGWQRAIRSRQVYDARVRSQSTQTLVVMNHKCSNQLRGLVLYSVGGDCVYNLPPFPGVDLNGDLPQGCQCISFDGKVYVLGGAFPLLKSQFKSHNDSLSVTAGVYAIDLVNQRFQSLAESHNGSRSVTAAVYVLDLVGQRKWKQCASMQDPRSEFGCGIINGKIYVIGGKTYPRNLVCGSEVYDPELDAWSPIAPTRYRGILRNVITVGEEIFVYDGAVVDDDYLNQHNDPNNASNQKPYVCKKVAHFAEVYHPLRNEWRIVDQFKQPESEILLMVGGRLQNLTSHGIDVYEISTNSWKPLQCCAFDALGPADSSIINLLAAVVVDDGLLAIVDWSQYDPHSGLVSDYGISVMRSEGLARQDTKISWCKTQLSLSHCDSHYDSPHLCVIQL